MNQNQRVNDQEDNENVFYCTTIFIDNFHQNSPQEQKIDWD